MAKGQETDTNGTRTDTETLLSVLRAEMPEASRGTLENFCDQSLLPPRARTGQAGRRPIWTYPIGTERQLRALMVWRKVTRDPDLLRVALWVDGYPVDVLRVQRSIRAALAKMAAEVDRAASAVAPENASEPERRRALAARAAGRRGKNTLVRRRRGVSAAERTRAFEALFETFVFGQVGDDSEETATQVLQLIGLSGAGLSVSANGVGPTLSAPPAAIFEATPHVGLQHLLEVAQTATDTELDLVRPSLNALLVSFPIVANLVSAAGGANAGSFTAISRLAMQPMAPVLFTPLLIGLHRSGQAQGVLEVTESLKGVPAQAAEILGVSQELTQKDMEANLKNEQPDVAATARGLLLDTPFEELEATLNRQAKDSIGQRARQRRKS